MRVSATQVERSIAALRRTDPGAARTPKAARSVTAELPDGLRARLTSTLAAAPAVRIDLVEAARARLAHGEHPTADDVAGTVVGRLVCDRLR